MIGGSDAGIAAALRARELEPGVEITVLVADAFPNFSICGLPYYLSADVPDWRDLAHRTTRDLEAAGIQLLLDHTAQAIDPAAKQVSVTSRHGERQLGYDRLVIGTGAVPVRPPIDGLDLDGVYVLHTMADTFALHQGLAAGARSAIIVGGGPISAPTLVIWGQRDRYLGPELAEPDHDDVPNLDRVERLPDASHWVHHDEAERVTQLLIDFFAPAPPTENR